MAMLLSRKFSLPQVSFLCVVLFRSCGVFKSSATLSTLIVCVPAHVV